MAKYKVRMREWVEWDEIVEADSIDEAEAAACERVGTRGHRVTIRGVYEATARRVDLEEKARESNR
jgi:hypothetical protein